MGFINNCYLNINPPEVWRKLEELGYTFLTYGHNEFAIDIWDLDKLSTYSAGWYQGSLDNRENHIDCGNNIDLFIALAALRDDTPINSFYWFNRRLVKCEDKTEKHSFLNGFIPILKCRCVDDPNVWFGAEECFLRKATVEEIIEHFKEN